VPLWGEKGFAAESPALLDEQLPGTKAIERHRQ